MRNLKILSDLIIRTWYYESYLRRYKHELQDFLSIYAIHSYPSGIQF